MVIKVGLGRISGMAGYPAINSFRFNNKNHFKQTDKIIIS